MPSIAKYWLFTINNYTDEERQGVIEKLRDCSQYFILGLEVGEAGTPHIQGYCILKKRHSLAQVKARISERAHFEIARGTSSANRTYCSKEGNFIEEGEIGDERHRSNSTGHTRADVAREFRMQIERGRLGIRAFADTYPDQWMFNGSNLCRNALLLADPIERPNISVEWIWGKPGVGKSLSAHSRLDGAYIKEPRTKWWNGYLLERRVIIDDFGPGGIDINHLLRWFDRYKCHVEVKGGMVALYADTFIVTSNFHPRVLFTDNLGVINPQYDALERRMTITEML